MAEKNMIIENILLWILSLLLGIGFVQHHVFYSFPPDLKNLKKVKTIVYPFLGTILYLTLKITYALLEYG